MVSVPFVRNVTGYAERIAPAVAQQDAPVSSALGIWLLLALVAPAATGRQRDELETALGCPADEAAKLAGGLLANPPPALAAAAALWSRPELRSPAFDRWATSLPAELDQGAVPSQAQADRWAQEHTLGLIRRMPVEMRKVLVVLVSALATKVSWHTPFEVAPADRFGPTSPWRNQTSQVLADPGGRGNHMAIVHTECAGLVGVHAARSREGIEVVSVIAESDIDRGAVAVAAHQAAAALTGETAHARIVPPAELPLGDGPAWTVTERQHGDRFSAVLPAWHGDGKLELLDHPAFAAHAATAVLGSFPKMAGLPRAIQVATATYHREGFEAAAITAIAQLVSAGLSRTPGRDIYLRFDRPYAAVAVAGAGSEHAGLPLFEAWVSEPVDAQGA
jgi:hypothetical protein